MQFAALIDAVYNSEHGSAPDVTKTQGIKLLGAIGYLVDRADLRNNHTKITSKQLKDVASKATETRQCDFGALVSQLFGEEPSLPIQVVNSLLTTTHNKISPEDLDIFFETRHLTDGVDLDKSRTIDAFRDAHEDIRNGIDAIQTNLTQRGLTMEEFAEFCLTRRRT